jgi:serine/threonine protein kinase
VIEQFREEGERLCLVMERVPGEPLDERLRRGAPMEPGEVQRVLVGVLEILEHLHGLAPPILHRDIKPGNIVVSDERVSLVDFGGVGRFLPWAKAASTVIGTFGYMAPEQLHGEATPASDLFGAGATAAALLAGCEASELPRQGLRIDVAAIPAAKGPLGAVVSRLVEPEPQRRFASAREVLEALARGGVAVATSAPVPPARPRSVVDAAARLHWAWRERIYRGLVGGGAASAIAGAIFIAIRNFGGSGFWREAGRALLGVGVSLFIASRFVRTRRRMQRKLLRLARRREGRLSTLDASVALGIPPEAASELLESLVQFDLARRDPDRDGGYRLR